MNNSLPPKAPADSPSPRALLFFLSNQRSYRAPLFSKNEIFCGPDAEAQAKNKRVLAIRTPAGTFDIKDVLQQIPAEQKPELVIVKADATQRNLPRNLASISGPKILLVGDTHHLRQPIRKLIEYAKQEPFDFVIFDHTRHHARFFAEAGVPNLYWLPAVDYGYVPRPLVARPSRPLTFVGQAGRHHPYRCAVLEYVKAAGLPLEVVQAPLAETANLYANSQVTLNISLNGDLNLRVFESLSAGGFLLTDELSVDSGLRRLFEPGVHLDTWRSPSELVDKIRHYLAHPDDVQRIRAAGQEEIQRNHTPAVKLKEFYELIWSGHVNPKYDFKEESWYRTGTSAAVSMPIGRIAAHEAMQELHRISSQITLINLASDRQADFAALPRIRFASHDEPSAEQVNLPSAVEPRVLCCDESTDDKVIAGFDGEYYLDISSAASVGDRLATWGLTPVRDDLPLYHLTRPGLWLQNMWQIGDRDLIRRRLPATLEQAHTADDCLLVAYYAGELNHSEVQCAALEAAIGLDRTCFTALVSFAVQMFERGQREAMAVLLEEAARVQPLPPEVETVRAKLADELGGRDMFAHYYRITGRQPVEPAETPLTVLVITNLLPPQELGGYGRSLWEFANGLKARGHRVRILTANAKEFEKAPTREEVEMEECVTRTLELAGTWVKGKVEHIGDRTEIMRRIRDNLARVRTAVNKQRPDLVLVGNIDLLGIGILAPVFAAEIPVVHSLGNSQPGYAVPEQPTSPYYCLAGASDWTANGFKAAGYSAARVDTVYPGARIDQFFRYFMPDNRTLRICYASLVLPYKGVHTLVAALVQLHQFGVDFTVEIAGDAPNPDFVAQLRQVLEEFGVNGKVHFSGFLDRAGLSKLFARNNILVFPSIVEEAFGISQVEALASGLAVVTTATGGASEIVRDGIDGLVFTAGDAADLAAKLMSLHQDRNRMAELQRNGQARAMSFAVDASVRKIETLAAEIRATVEAAAQAEEFPVAF